MKRELKTVKSQETKEKILAAALKLFSQKGFDQTTMRDIAQNAEIALGAAYYYFHAKEEIVWAFYMEIQEKTENALPKILAEENDFKMQIERLIIFKLKQLQPYRSFINVLARCSGDPHSHLSPFSPGSEEIRSKAIHFFEVIVEASKIDIDKEMRLYLPKILWLYQMGIIFFWIHDRSEHQKKTFRLLQGSLGIIMQFLKLSLLPGTGKVKRNLINILKESEQ